MLIYARILGETSPGAFNLSASDATVGQLLDQVRAARAGSGRSLELMIDGAEPGRRLADLGVHDFDLVNIRASGQPGPASHSAAVAEASQIVDFEAIAVTPQAGARRLSEYEEVTQLTQWHAPFHIDGGRPSQKIWSDENSVLRSRNWDTYRSPDKLYYRTYTAQQARAERAVSTAFRFAEEAGQLSDVNPAHVDQMRQLVGPLQYPDWGLCVAHQNVTRFAMSSWIAGAASFMMFDELRHAQLYGRLALAYSAHHDGFDDPRPTWMDAARFQPTRRLTEELLAVLDWGQATIVASLLVEPAITSTAQSLLMAGSVTAGDPLTQFVCQSIAEDKARHRHSATEFLKMVSDDPSFADANRGHIAGWVADWGPRAIDAARALSNRNEAAERALGDAMAASAEILEAAGINAESISQTELGASPR